MVAGPKVRCKKCGDVIQSMSVHDMKTCQCRAIAIDGGGCYTKLIMWPDAQDYIEFVDNDPDNDDHANGIAL